MAMARARGGWRTGVLARSIASGLCCCLLNGCGAAGPQVAAPPPEKNASSNPYQSEIDSLREDADSAFVQSVLQDGIITEVEFVEAFDSEVRCLRDAGLNPMVDSDPQGLKQFAMPSDEVPAQLKTDCWQQWDGGIVDLYPLMKSNPNNDDLYDLWAACFVQQGLVPPGLTGEQLREYLAPASQEGGTNSDGETWEGPPPEDPDPALPNGLRPLSDDTHGCMVDPVGVMTRSGSETP